MFTYYHYPCLPIIIIHVYLLSLSMFTYYHYPCLPIIIIHVYLLSLSMFTYYHYPCLPIIIIHVYLLSLSMFTYILSFHVYRALIKIILIILINIIRRIACIESIPAQILIGVSFNMNYKELRYTVFSQELNLYDFVKKTINHHGFIRISFNSFSNTYTCLF